MELCHKMIVHNITTFVKVVIFPACEYLVITISFVKHNRKYAVLGKNFVFVLCEITDISIF